MTEENDNAHKVWNSVCFDGTPSPKGHPTEGREICGPPMCYPEYEQPSWAINKRH